jgi:serine/threonine protein kinase
VYCVFEHLGQDTQALWEYCEVVAKEISALFPKPMSLAFEEVIYWRLLTLTKKRYMSLKCDKFGNINPKVEKKGVLLSRRDNSNFVRTVYQHCVMSIFDRKDGEIILSDCLDYINRLSSHSFDSKDFVITKSIGFVPDGIDSITPVKGKPGKGQYGDYNVPILCEEGSKKYEQFVKRYEEGDFYEDVSILISEWADGSDLLEYLRENFTKLTVKEWRVMFFQILSVLAIIQTKYPTFRHNDLKANNILIQKIQQKSKFNTYKYTINNNEYFVPNTGVRCKLWDFDFACIPGIVENSKVNSDWTDKINVKPVQNRYYDLHYFLELL